jgi:myo-inositol 2-dehydrogenase / D-chiro-inositol 1-dehydrogenase
MRLGIIGVGRIGAFHARTLSALAEVTSLVLTDVSPDLAGRVAADTDAEVAPTPERLLASGVEGVVIAASTEAHPALLRACVAAGLPTFCEKPVAKLADEAVRIAALAGDAGVAVQIGYPRRFDPGFAAARAAVASGELGRITTVRSTTLDPGPPSAAYLATSGGIFRDCAVHDFDAVRWVTGCEVVEVFATGTPFADLDYADLDDVSTAAAVLTLDNGALAVVSNTRYNGGGYDVRLEVHGSKEAIAVGLDDRLPLRSVEADVRYPAGPPATFFMDRLATAFRAELTAFVDVVAGRQPSPCTLQDALETGWVAEACARSLQEGRSVAVDEVRLAPSGATPR